jgi:hypothetical protein
MTVLGSRIPSPWYEWLDDTRYRVVHERKCRDCGHRYPTVEVPLFNKWRGGLAMCCPNHPSVKGPVVDAITPAQADRGKQYSQGLAKARSLGAVYRRRRCRPAGTSKIANLLCKQRWTTIELAPDGILRDDVSVCPKCGGKTRARIKKVAG